MKFDTLKEREYHSRLRIFIDGITTNVFTHQDIIEMVTLYRFRFDPSQQLTKCGSCIRRMLKNLRQERSRLG
jgi:DNA-binding winged helix-turn-helix (wHTH) protein